MSHHPIETSLQSSAMILGAMGLLTLIEVLTPLHARDARNRAHLAPNLWLTFITIATNVFLNAGLLLLLAHLEARGFGLLRWAGTGSIASFILAVIGLDFSFYLAHVAMHKVPAFWRIHRVHHSDPVIDVSSTIRQHPLEGLIRYAVMALCSALLGVGLGAFALYRAWSAISGLLEHANIRVPQRLDTALSYVATFPNMHKVHHSRDRRETDSNYGNIFPWFDHCLSTFTPAVRGATVECGLDGLDERSDQTTRGLLALPFQAQVRPPPSPRL